MALVQCPDCGKMVSSRATVCPFCGCPSEFFVMPDDDNQPESDSVKNITEEDKSTVTGETSENNMVPSEEEDQQHDEIFTEEEHTVVDVNHDPKLITFNFAAYSINFPQGTERYAQIFGNYLEAADKAYAEMCKEYDNAGNIEKALQVLPDKANKLINDIISDSVKYLYNNGIHEMNTGQFISKYNRKYCMDYSSFIDKTVEKYADILGEKQQLAAYRAEVQSSRGRWVGGGFGIGGAVKGYVTASAMNLGSDFLHSFGDSSRKRKDDKAIQGKLATLYRSSKEQLCLSAKNCIMNVHKAMIDEMERYNLLEPVFHVNKEYAETEYNNSIKYESDPGKTAFNMFSCIYSYPGDIRYYEKVRDILIRDDSEIEEFAKFWHIEYLLKDILLAKNLTHRFETYALQNGIEEFDFNDDSAENAAVMLAFLGEYNGNLLKCESPWYKKIKTYFSNFLHRDSEFEKEILSNYIPSDRDIDSFWGNILKNEDDLQITFIGPKWCIVAGAYSEGPEPSEAIIKKNGWDQPENLIKMYCDTSMMQTGSKGLAITNKYVMDLKSKVMIPVDKITNISVKQGDGNRYLIEFTDGTQIIQFQNDEIKNSRKRAWYLRNVLNVMFIRYLGNAILKENTAAQNSRATAKSQQCYESEKARVNEANEQYAKKIEEQNNQRKEKYMRYIQEKLRNGPNAYDFVFSNMFRKRAKYMLRLSYNTSHCINKYDFELDEGNLKNIFEGREGGFRGEYILYAYDGIIITDQCLYATDERDFSGHHYGYLPWDSMKEVIVNHSAKGSHTRILNHTITVSRDGKTRGELPQWMSDTVADAINVALEPFIDPNVRTHYGSQIYYCQRCNSRNIQKKITGGYRCLDCPKGSNEDIAWYGTEDDKLELNRNELNRRLSGKKDEDEYWEKDIWKDEDLQVEWLKEYGLWKPIEETEEILNDTTGSEESAATIADEIVCPRCGKKLASGVKFCNYCGFKIGDPVPIICPNCGKTLKPNVKFCNYCGTKIIREKSEESIDNKNPESEMEAYIITHYYPDNKTQACKYYRDMTGAGLKEALDKVNEIFNAHQQ